MEPPKTMFKRVIAVMLLMLLAGCVSHADTVQNLTARQAMEIIEQHSGDPDFVVLDVRTPAEFKQGHIKGAVLLNYHDPGFKKGLMALDKTKTYLIYCRTGNRSARTLKHIADMGFAKVYHLAGGIRDWQKERLPLVKPGS